MFVIGIIIWAIGLLGGLISCYFGAQTEDKESAVKAVITSIGLIILGSIIMYFNI